MSSPTPTAYVPRPYRPRSIFGPLLLIAIGVLFLLRNMRLISYEGFHWWFSRYWPVLLILWGAIRLFEYYWARSRGYRPPRLGAGSIFFLIFFIMFGLGVTTTRDVHWNDFGWDPYSDSDFGFFGTRYEFSDSFAQALEPAAAQINVLCARGDITVKPSADGQAHLFLHKYVRTSSQESANRMNEATHPKFQQQGGVWVLDMTGSDYEHGRFNLDLELPPNTPLSLTTHHGDLQVSDRQGNVTLSTDHGDIRVEQVKGDATLHISHGSATAKDLKGDLTLDGIVSDVNVADVTGSVSLSGTYWGDMQLSHIAKQFHLSTSRTDLQFAKLDGDFNMQPDELRATSIGGPFRLDTRSKTVHLEDVSGDVHINDRNATVEIRPSAPLGNIDVSSLRGEIDLELPANAGFQLDAESVGGEIQSDFSVNLENGHIATAKGTVGKGGPMVRLRTDHGTIQLRKQ